jgi:hypothetical protein
LPVFSRGIALDLDGAGQFVGVVERFNSPCPFSAQVNSRGSPFHPKGQAETFHTNLEVGFEETGGLPLTLNGAQDQIAQLSLDRCPPGQGCGILAEVGGGG